MSFPEFDAELADFAAAYWDGHRVVYCFLRDDGIGKFDEEFDPTHYVWAEWHDEVRRLASRSAIQRAPRTDRLDERCAAVRR